MGRNNIRYAKGLYSPFQLLGAANAHFALSEAYTSTFPEDQETMSQTPIDMDKSLASATNRILAVELYFKSLLVALPVPVPMVHDLVVLFEHLPPEVCNTITQHYNHYTRQISSDHAQAVIITFRLNVAVDVGKMKSEIVQPDINLSLATLLELNRDGFVDSRYLFERAVTDESRHYIYHYRRLAILCRVLREILDVSLAAASANPQ